MNSVFFFSATLQDQDSSVEFLASALMRRIIYNHRLLIIHSQYGIKCTISVSDLHNLSQSDHSGSYFKVKVNRTAVSNLLMAPDLIFLLQVVHSCVRSIRGPVGRI